MTSKYPNALDDNISLPACVNLITPVDASTFNNLRSAVLAIESELAPNCSGVYATVKARLDAMTSLIGQMGGVSQILFNGNVIVPNAKSINIIGDPAVISVFNAGGGQGNITIGTPTGTATGGTNVNLPLNPQQNGFIPRALAGNFEYIGGTGTATGAALVWNGIQWEAGNPVSTGSATGFSNIVVVQDRIIATAGQTAFTLSQVITNASSLLMFINELKVENIYYTISNYSVNVTYIATNYTVQANDAVEFYYILNTSSAPSGGFTGGITGPVGPQGPTGSIGPTGLQGVTGPQGVTGVAGLAGTAATGPFGPQGSPGVTGSTGPTGPQGIQGVTGFTGPRGNTGPIGAQGVTGATGPAGSIGSQGIQGIPGVTGPTGPAGLQGIQGPTGTIGPQGLQGSPGVTGPSTSLSSSLPVGITSPTGYQGIATFTSRSDHIHAHGNQPIGPLHVLADNTGPGFVPTLIASGTVLLTPNGSTQNWTKITDPFIATGTISPNKSTVGSANTVIWSDGTTNQWSTSPIVTNLTATSDVTIGSTSASSVNLVFTVNSLSPKISQAQATGTSLIGQSLIIWAQSVAGTTTTGGNLQLKSGAGTSANGNVDIYAGSTLLCDFSSAAITSSLSTLQFLSTVSNPVLQQATNSLVSATGQPLLIQAQNCNNSLSIGGQLVLASGYGLANRGTVVISIGGPPSSGGITSHIFDITSVTQYTSNYIFDSTVVGPTIYQSPVTGNGQQLTIVAQNSNGTGVVGGSLSLKGGTGDTTANSGSVTIYSGNTYVCGFQYNDATLYVPNLYFGTSVSPVITQQTPASGAGNNFNISAQSGGTGGSGGQLQLYAGNGDGNIGGDILLFAGNGTSPGTVYIGAEGSFGSGLNISMSTSSVTVTTSTLVHSKASPAETHTISRLATFAVTEDVQWHQANTSNTNMFTEDVSLPSNGMYKISFEIWAQGGTNYGCEEIAYVSIVGGVNVGSDLTTNFNKLSPAPTINVASNATIAQLQITPASGTATLWTIKASVKRS